MDIGKRYDSVRRSWLARAADAVVLGSTRPIWRRVLGDRLTESGIRRREAERHRHSVELGARAIRQATEANDTQLRWYGEAMIAKAVATAVGPADDDVRRTLVQEVGRPLPLQMSAGNPYVHPEVMDKVAAILRFDSEPQGGD